MLGQKRLIPPVGAALLGLALMGPVGKCAQFPLHLWLDEAMEAPSPASGLRNSLVVSCGAYVLIKMQPILAISPVVTAALIELARLQRLGHHWYRSLKLILNGLLISRCLPGTGLHCCRDAANRFALMLILAHAVAKALLYEY